MTAIVFISMYLLLFSIFRFFNPKRVFENQGLIKRANTDLNIDY